MELVTSMQDPVRVGADRARAAAGAHHVPRHQAHQRGCLVPDRVVNPDARQTLRVGRATSPPTAACSSGSAPAPTARRSRSTRSCARAPRRAVRTQASSRGRRARVPVAFVLNSVKGRGSPGRVRFLRHPPAQAERNTDAARPRSLPSRRADRSEFVATMKPRAGHAAQRRDRHLELLSDSDLDTRAARNCSARQKALGADAQR